MENKKRTDLEDFVIKHKGNFYLKTEVGYKKIILTTDQLLDDVQAIDNEFLEWFVKNPSCEEVKVQKWSSLAECGYSYHIIIPKEEPKQETLEEIRNEEMPEDYYPPKDLANAIWGTCFQYKDIETDGIIDKVKNACFMIEKIYKIKELCQK